MINKIYHHTCNLSTKLQYRSLFYVPPRHYQQDTTTLIMITSLFDNRTPILLLHPLPQTRHSDLNPLLPQIILRQQLPTLHTLIIPAIISCQSQSVDSHSKNLDITYPGSEM